MHDITAGRLCLRTVVRAGRALSVKQFLANPDRRQSDVGGVADFLDAVTRVYHPILTTALRTPVADAGAERKLSRTISYTVEKTLQLRTHFNG